MKYIVIDTRYADQFRVVGFTNYTLAEFIERNQENYNFNNMKLKQVELKEEAFRSFGIDMDIRSNFIDTLKGY